MRHVHLLQLTDPHLYADAAGEVYGVNTAQSLRRVLDEVLGDGGQRPDAIVVTGDIADDLSAAAYRRLRDALAGTRLPVYCLPGNHDDPARMREVLDGDGFQYCGRATLGDWGLVMADSRLPGEVGGRLSAAELHRIDDDLAAFHDRPVVVCLHHPPVAVGSAWLDASGLGNAREFFEVVERHRQVKAVLAGHVHQAYDALRRGTRIMTTPSTCAQFRPASADFALDAKPPGYRWLTLHEDGSLQAEARWVRD